MVADSADLAAKRVAMAALLREERRAAVRGASRPEAPDARARRHEAMEIMRRGLA